MSRLVVGSGLFLVLCVLLVVVAWLRKNDAPRPERPDDEGIPW